MPFSYYCSCPEKHNKCPKGSRKVYRLLDTSEVLPRQTDGIIRFTIGKCFPKTKIKVIATFSEGILDDVITKTCLTTDCNGNYQIPLPDGFTPNNATVTTQIKVDLEQPKPTKVCPKDLVKVPGYYPPFSYYQLEWPSWDGTSNNLSHPEWGSVDVALLRKGDAAYADSSSTLAVRGINNPNPRVVSNNIHKNISGNVPNSLGLTDITWIFGQFIDHEITLTEPLSGGETATIITPDVITDPAEEYPGRAISFTRSNFILNTDPREQPNQISAFIDSTNVYGYNGPRAMVLRRLDGTGKLKTDLSDNGEILMPKNTFGFHNAEHGALSSDEFFLGGDIRSNENIFLSALHTLMVREHNRWCDVILTNNPIWEGKDELIYQYARRMVSGIMSNITYQEYLPALLGEQLPSYKGYDSTINPGIATEFSTAAYRLGHSMITSNLKTGSGVGDTILLRNAFFNPSFLDTNGIDGLLLGSTLQHMQEIDNEIIDDLRNFLFMTPTAEHLLDLVSINIQRGRDHGLPAYNDFREAYGLSRKTSFSEVTSDSSLATKLTTLYGSPDNGDPWSCILCEDRIPGAAVGETIKAALRDQFLRLRDGDRFYFENDKALTDADKNIIRNTKLSDIIIRNTQWTSAEIRDDVFHL